MSNASSTHSLASVGSSRIRSVKEYVVWIQIYWPSCFFSFEGLHQDRFEQEITVRKFGLFFLSLKMISNWYYNLDKQDSSNSLARSSSANELALRKKNAAAASSKKLFNFHDYYYSLMLSLLDLNTSAQLTSRNYSQEEENVWLII